MLSAGGICPCSQRICCQRSGYDWQAPQLIKGVYLISNVMTLLMSNTHHYRWLAGQVLEELETTFDQWTASPRARLFKDPATKMPNGHALVSLSNPRHAQYLETDMNDMVFMYAGAPRPLQARVAIPGESSTFDDLHTTKSLL